MKQGHDPFEPPDYYWGVSDETRFLPWLIDRERDRCVRAVEACPSTSI
ncbi:MAG: hypothetical protein V4792_03725 [Pseudomonadota bacterium]